jgi:hypothetical protein
MRLKRTLAALCVSSMVAVVGVSPALAGGNNSNQIGLVNVSLGDVSILNNVNLAVAADLAATICGVTVPVAVLAHQVVAGSGTFTCDTTTGPLTVTQALNGAPAGTGGGGNNSHQTGLVNVSTGDVSLLNNVNLAVAANVAATLCGISVPVAVLAVQVFGPTGMFTCSTATGPLTVTQSQHH